MLRLAATAFSHSPFSADRTAALPRLAFSRADAGRTAVIMDASRVVLGAIPVTPAPGPLAAMAGRDCDIAIRITPGGRGGATQPQTSLRRILII